MSTTTQDWLDLSERVIVTLLSELSPVSIIEYLLDLEALGGLGEAHHVVRAADLDEGEVGGPGKLGGQGGLA